MPPAGPWELALGGGRGDLFFARSAIKKKKKGHVAQKPGFCVSKTAVFAQPVRRLGAFLSAFRVLDAQIWRFPMARARLIFRFGAFFFSWGREKIVFFLL